MTESTVVGDYLLSTSSVGIRVDAIGALDTVMSALKLAYKQERAWLMTFANPATAVRAARDPGLLMALKKFDVVAPDGIAMALAIRILHGKSARRISFDDTSLAPGIFRLAIEHGLRVVLIGGLPGIAETAAERLTSAYPGLQIDFVSDGYGDADATIRAIVARAPGIVIVGMGTPLQERFLLKLVASGWVGLGFTCGGYLDQLSLKGTEYYPRWIDRYNIRWLYRFMMEPGRLWRRYLLDYPYFVARLGVSLLCARRQADFPSGSSPSKRISGSRSRGFRG